MTTFRQHDPVHVLSAVFVAWQATQKKQVHNGYVKLRKTVQTPARYARVELTTLSHYKQFQCLGYNRYFVEVIRSRSARYIIVTVAS